MEGVVISNPEVFEQKKKKFLAGGPEALQIISDFDMTITRYWIDGKRGQTCHGVIEHAKQLGPEFGQKTHALFDKYYPIEFSPTVPNEEKEIAMVEWWTKAHDLMFEYGLKEHHIPEFLSDANIEPRIKCRELFEYLVQKSIPLLIFSAGLANVVKEFLKLKGIYHKNIHVISNLMTFDEEGKLKGFEGKLIHSMNKSAHVLKDVPTDWAHDEKRKNILLLGDSLMDVNMKEGLNYSEVISIGFLNDRIEDRLHIYKNLYDVVILNDGTMDFALQLVNEIVQNK